MTYRIYGYYRGKWEKVDQAYSERDAYRLCGEYRVAFGQDWVLEVRGGKKT